ncbi:hypothetical protein RSJ42_07825 [Methanosarcina hadiensis]|uniref:hypothetical protein n=1 Tax=Methanosarcina hadiensis TaxID=3078083 RepID=UPI003977AC44
MVKLAKVIRYISYITLLLILFSVLSPAALAGNGPAPDNNGKKERAHEALQKKNMVQEENQSGNQSEDETLEQKQFREESMEKKQIKEQLRIQRNNYQASKKNFLSIRKNLRSGNYDEEDLNITREYLSASIDYMIAQLEKVKYNIEQSNGNGTEARITSIEDRINQLQEEKKAIEEAEDLADLTNATESVRGVWNNVKNRTAVETGEAACEKIDGFVNRSGAVSNKIEKEIENLNETGVNTTGLEAKLADYKALMDSARENNEAAKEIHSKENITEEELRKADSYLQNSLEEIKEANQILNEIYGELKQYRVEEPKRDRIRGVPGTELNNTENLTVDESENLTWEGLES